MSLTKVWDDGDDQEGNRPAGVTFKPIKNGATSDQTLVFSKTTCIAKSWNGEFEGLADYVYKVRDAIIKM